MAARKLAAYADFGSYAEFLRVAKARAAKVAAEYGTEYLDRLPATIPPGKLLVHNSVRPQRQLGLNGFRAFLIKADGRWRGRCEPCDCAWAPKLGQHYRTSSAARH